MQTEIAALLDMYVEEPLNSDLMPFLDDHMLRHPLVHTFYTPMHAKMVNGVYLQKQKAIKEYIEQKKWLSYIMMYERPYRLFAFMEIMNLIETEQDYWNTVAFIWKDTEFPWRSKRLWTRVFSKPNTHLMMELEDREKLASLPDVVTIYRGINCIKGKNGFSWTLNKNRANWFANRLKQKSQTTYIATGQVRKEKIIAYLSGRNEEEILVLPKDVKNKTTERLFMP